MTTDKPLPPDDEEDCERCGEPLSVEDDLANKLMACFDRHELATERLRRDVERAFDRIGITGASREEHADAEIGVTTYGGSVGKPDSSANARTAVGE